MHIKRPLDDILSSPNQVRVLRHLVLFPSPVITGRGLARELGMSHVSCIRSLNSLVAIGVLTRKTIGTSTTYEIPTESILCSKMLKPLFSQESKLLDGLVRRLLIDIKESVQAVYLFGSVARRDDTPHSDVDILLILTEGASKKSVEKMLGNNKRKAYSLYRVGINVITYGYNEFKKKKQQGRPLIKEILKEGVLLAGKEV